MARHAQNGLVRAFSSGSYSVSAYPGQSVAIQGNDAYLPVRVKIDPPIADAWKNALDAEYTTLTGQFVELEGMQESANPQYSPVSVIGRMENIMVYAGGSNREVGLSFRFQANTYEDLDEVRMRALWLDALKMPWVSSADLSNPPPAVWLTVGNHLNMRAIVGSCQITWLGPFLPGTLEPSAAQVDVHFISVYNGSYAHASVNWSADRYVSRKATVGGPSNSITNSQRTTSFVQTQTFGD